MTGWARVLVNLVVCLGMLVVLPAAMGLVDSSRPLAAYRGWRPWSRGWAVGWFAGAVPGAVSLWLPRGWVAAVLAGCYVFATASLLPVAVVRLVRWVRAPGRWADARDVAVAAALVAPTVASISLVAERAGHRLFGFKLDVLALTVAHFHYAGFAAALTAALVAGLAGAGRAGSAAAVSVPAGTAVVFVGFFTAEWVELAGAVILTAGMWLTAWLTWRLALPAAPDRTVRALLSTSAVVLVATMLLALDWAAGEVTGLPHLSLSWMVATHGVANALGFGLCGLMAWRALKEA